VTDEAISGAYAALRRAIDGEPVSLTGEDAQALHAALWDTKAALGRSQVALEVSRKRNKALTEECNALVDQVVAEEARAVRAETTLSRALAILRAVVAADTFREVRPRAQKLVDEVDGKGPKP
jgi:hypothetical protein